jgi:enoyl-CoA hydratase/carnithine racemase
MIDELVWALETFEKSSEVNAIVIKSSHPKIFCAGADIKRFLKEEY